MNSEPTAKIGLLLSLGVSCFAFAPILVRAADMADPVALATLRTVSAALILFPFWLYYRSKGAFEQYGSKDMQRAFWAGCSLGLHFICWIAALNLTSVASASVLVTMHPIILILVESRFYGQKFHALAWTGVLIAFSGSVLLGISDGLLASAFEHALLGDALAVLAACLFAAYFLISRDLRQRSGWLNYIFWVYTFTALVCLSVAVITTAEFRWDYAFIFSGVGLAIGPQILGHGSFNYSVKYISPTILSTLILTEPVLATLLALLIFAEVPPIFSILSMLVILFGVLLTWKGRLNSP